MCVLRWSDRANFLWHVSHSKGFTPTQMEKGNGCCGGRARCHGGDLWAHEAMEILRSKNKIKIRIHTVTWSLRIMLDRHLLIFTFFYLLQLMTVILPRCLSYVGQRYCAINAFIFSAMMTKSIYKEGNWEMEPDSQMLHFHPSIFDLSLLYLMQGCWKLSRLTAGPRTALQFVRAPTHQDKQPNTTGYVL